MKVLHINTSNSGGASKAAIRLHLALLEAGVESNFLYLKGDNKISVANSCQYQKSYPSFFQRMMRKSGLKRFKNDKISWLYNYAQGEFDAISYFESDYEIHKHQLFQEADIINLHWVGNFLDYSTFFRECKKPIVWTMHDKNPCMGCFHLELDSHRNNNLKEIDHNLLREKAKIVASSQNLNLVCLSRALMDYSKRSQTFKDYPHYCIPNSVDTDFYRDFSCANPKLLLTLPEDKMTVLVFSYPVTVFHKGMDLFLEMFRKYEFPKLHFLFVGEPIQAMQTRNSYSSIPFVKDELLMRIIYSASDILAITSREENLPNVMLEAMSCGTPVLSFPVGGMLDVIKNGLNGILAEGVGSEALANSLKDLNEGRYDFDREKIREFAVSNFASCVQAKKYIELYKSLLA